MKTNQLALSGLYLLCVKETNGSKKSELTFGQWLGVVLLVITKKLFARWHSVRKMHRQLSEIEVWYYELCDCDEESLYQQPIFLDQVEDMAVCDELRHLEGYLTEQFRKGTTISDLYELVQYCGNIVPRLWVQVAMYTWQRDICFSLWRHFCAQFPKLYLQWTGVHSHLLVEGSNLIVSYCKSRIFRMH